MKSNHFALIMAGGQGTRFWPWSTAERPKQFLAVVGKQPLITQTYRRLRRFIPAENIFIIADRRYLPAVQECLPGFPRRNYIAEPAPRNTAPALIQANIVLSRIDPAANLLVVPADHHIADEKAFARQLTSALRHADNRCVITAGIKPSEPHTGYGYIHFSEREHKGEFFPVKQFKEKPDHKTASDYLEKGTFYWNSGMFVYKMAFFKDFLKKYAPYYGRQYDKLERSHGQPGRFAKIYKAITPESIDYVLMEKLKQAVMFKAEFAWNDVGSWTSVYEMNEKDPEKNVCRGRTIAVDTRNSLLFSCGRKPLAVIGLERVAVIDTENGILVAPIDKLQQVKRVIDILKKKKN
ncbi:MAG: sugar phosphate nucleotidyltransferase [Acidobacteria bacterium]|jgi:mannose-1-phosphate guanylyltransferase|nr:sugar phosphate nucleotidyltransferase [Acidobacteriota bacterium]